MYFRHTAQLPQVAMNYRNYGSIATSQTPVEVAWELCQNHPHIQEDFTAQARTFKWDEKFDITPFWAYWFARNVITDEWLAGEDLIMLNDQVWSWYVAYTERLRECGAIGHTTKDDPDFVVDHYGSIKGWRPGRGPVLREGRMAKRTTLVERFGTTEAAAIADRIAQQMDEHKKNRKLKDIKDDDED